MLWVDKNSNQNCEIKRNFRKLKKTQFIFREISKNHGNSRNFPTKEKLLSNLSKILQSKAIISRPPNGSFWIKALKMVFFFKKKKMLKTKKPIKKAIFKDAINPSFNFLVSKSTKEPITEISPTTVPLVPGLLVKFS